MLSRVRSWAPSRKSKSQQLELQPSKTEVRLRRSSSDSTDNTDSTRPGSDTSHHGSTGSSRNGRHRGPIRHSPPASENGELNLLCSQLPTCYEGTEQDDASYYSSGKSRSIGRFGNGFGKSRSLSHPTSGNGGYQDQDDDVRSVRSIGSRFSARSILSRASRLSLHMPLRHGAGPEDWSEAGSAREGDLFESEDEDDEIFVLLKHSRPMKIGPGQDFHMVRIVRASLDQPFGINFDASESRHGGSTTFLAAADYPYLSVKRRDRLVSLNGKQLSRAADVTEALENALSITLVFQRRGSQFHGPQPRLSDCRVPMSEVNRSLLSVTSASVINRKRGEFKLAMHRTSVKQRFGLLCEAVASQPGSPDVSIIISEDMPHLALKKNDRLCVINGMEARSRSECVKMMRESLSISMTFRRHPSRLHELVHDIQEIGDDIAEIEEFDLLPACCLGPCNFLGPDVNHVDMHRPAQVQAHSWQQPADVMSGSGSATHRTYDYRRPTAQQKEVYEYDAMGGAVNMSSSPGILCFSY